MHHLHLLPRRWSLSIRQNILTGRTPRPSGLQLSVSITEYNLAFNALKLQISVKTFENVLQRTTVAFLLQLAKI